MNIVIDFEFTGLDNSYIKDNEIIEMKATCIETGRALCRNYGTEKKLSAYTYLSHRKERYEGDKFSKDEFWAFIELIKDGNEAIHFYYGFGVTQDMSMLAKYDIDISIIDIREKLQLSEFDYRLATEGSGLEAAYYIVTGKIPQIENHCGLDEIYIIAELYEASLNLELKEFLEFMPHGHCAGMPLKEYVELYRRAADGYRFNNCDTLSYSLTSVIENNEGDFDPFDTDEEEYDDD